MSNILSKYSYALSPIKTNQYILVYPGCLTQTRYDFGIIYVKIIEYSVVCKDNLANKVIVDFRHITWYHLVSLGIVWYRLVSFGWY